MLWLKPCTSYASQLQSGRALTVKTTEAASQDVKCSFGLNACIHEEDGEPMTCTS